MNYTGVIIEESLADKSYLDKVKVVKTKVEEVTAEHKTPHLKNWTLHTVEVAEDKADEVAEMLSHAISTNPIQWYADFKNDITHYIIFHDKVFRIDRSKLSQYEEATAYGISVGIPAHQVDFAPNVKEWKRSNY